MRTKRAILFVAAVAVCVGFSAFASATHSVLAGAPAVKAKAKKPAAKPTKKPAAVVGTGGAIAVVSTAAVIEIVAPKTPPAAAKISAPPRGKSPSEPALVLLPESVVNGGVALLTVTGLTEGDQVTGTFNGQAIPFAALDGGGRATALVAVDIDVKAGAKYPVKVRIKRPAGSPAVTRETKLAVTDAKYEIETINVPPEKDSGDDPKLMKRIASDQRALAVLWPVWNAERLWAGGFIKPVPGEVRSTFGGRRVINGLPRRPHAGIDQRGAEGTPIVAIQHARVAYVGDQFFSGNVTVLDHGQGVYSMYAHQSRVVVKKDQLVTQGEKIGEIGMTGRVTGPHLHWGLRVNGARIDPLRLLELDLASTGVALSGSAALITMSVGTSGP